MLYQVFITQDGSPTLIWPGKDGASEKMHHSAGALSESFYIYHEALRETVTRGLPIRVLSLGLGIGYNELIAVGEASVSGVSGWKIWSFESSAPLREGFAAWLKGGTPGDPLQSTYDQVLRGVAGKLSLAPEALKSSAREGLSNGRLELRAGFPGDSEGTTECTTIFYDAFSKKMSPELWIEDDIVAQLEPIAADHCVLATYANNGVLNRALKRLGFRLSEKKGFSSKRGVTLAIR